MILMIKEPKGFKIRLRYLPLFLGLGWGSIGLMTCCYFTATDEAWQLFAWLLGTGVITAVIPFIVIPSG